MPSFSTQSAIRMHNHQEVQNLIGENKLKEAILNLKIHITDADRDTLTLLERDYKDLASTLIKGLISEDEAGRKKSQLADRILAFSRTIKEERSPQTLVSQRPVPASLAQNQTPLSLKEEAKPLLGGDTHESILTHCDRVEQINAVSSHEEQAPLVQSYGLWGEACHKPHQAYLPLVPTICQSMGANSTTTFKPVVKSVACTGFRPGLDSAVQLNHLWEAMKKVLGFIDLEQAFANYQANHVFFFVFQIPSHHFHLRQCIKALHDRWQKQVSHTYKVRFIWLFEGSEEPKARCRNYKRLPPLANVSKDDIKHFVSDHPSFRSAWDKGSTSQNDFSMQEVLELLAGSDHNPNAMQPDHSPAAQHYAP